MKPLCIDLFCGYGGWARGFLDVGYRVHGFDNEPRCASKYPGEFHLMDIRELDGRALAHACVIVASPPCNEFSSLRFLTAARLGTAYAPNPDKGLILVKEAKRIIDEALPDFWCIENVKGSIRYISTILGKPKLTKHPQNLWGNFPGFLLPNTNRSKKMVQMYKYVDGKRIYLGGSRDQRKRAIIPYPLARALAEACKP